MIDLRILIFDLNSNPQIAWTAVTEDGQPAAHFEHTVAVTETGVDVLTDGRESPVPQPAEPPLPSGA